MQNVVYHVFVVVAGVIGTLLAIGLTGILVLLATHRDTPHAHPIRQA